MDGGKAVAWTENQSTRGANTRATDVHLVNDSQALTIAQVTPIKVSLTNQIPSIVPLKATDPTQLLRILATRPTKKINLTHPFLITHKIQPLNAKVPAITHDQNDSQVTIVQQLEKWTPTTNHVHYDGAQTKVTTN